MTSATNETIILNATFEASADAVYAAWTQPDLMRRWTWGTIGRDVVATVDARAGGAYRITTSNTDGTTCSFHGAYIALEPAKHVELTLFWDAPMGYDCGEERLIVDLEERNGQTQMRFAHEGVPSDIARTEHRKAWENVIGVLKEVVEG